MDMDFVSQLLENSDIVTQNEYNLFKALLHWLESEERREHFHAYAKELLPLIRFPQMQAKELLLVEQNDLYQDKELGPLLKKLMGMAYRFHVFCRHQTELVVSFAQDFYQPRNYLDLAVDNVHIQRNMRDAAEIDVKIYGGLAFLGSYDGDWKVYYKKYKEAWVVNTQCYKTASQVGAAQVQCALIITNKDDQVLQVKESEVTVSARGAHLNVQAVLNMDLSKSMAVLFKPIPK
ncbi:BTB/POZ domain-containing protein 17-like isoform X3 [Biomphalaria glabrata]|uniref:Uncharacterized protein LOC106058273 n=1 Tax=Biomphalaria glabrata TaxID=6526 RepID=A0A9W3B8F8_BIOGL|nr:uncharacterized protein LOC106058273 [Biomphalaria glabrata]KAI8734177.1 BTB/POZ domain-containing protein 17-like isoform X3 [Biomphalaria glabrata]